MIHLGIDTVELDGEGFTTEVSVGDKVKTGDVLGTMDVEKIKSLKKPVTSMLILTSGETINIVKDTDEIVVEPDLICTY